MRAKAVTFESVCELAREFPDLEQGAMYGSPAIKLGKRLVVCVPSHRSAEPDSLVVRTDFDQREALLADDPQTYYLTDHYANHPVVLVRLARQQPGQMRDLIAAARQCVIAHAARKKNQSSNRTHA